MLKFSSLKNSSSYGHEDAATVLKRRAFFLFWVALMHSLCFYIFEKAQGINYFDSIWVTFVTFSTIGYGDVHAQTIMGKLTTIIFATFSGIYLLVATIEGFITWTKEKRENQLLGKFSWGFENHIVICNFPKYYNESQMLRLIKEIRGIENLKEKKIIIISNRYSGNFLSKVFTKEKDIVHVDGSPSIPEYLNMANIKKASHILILSRLEDSNPDGDTFDIIHRIKTEFNKKAVIIAQCENLENKNRFIKVGASNVLKPMPSYPEATAYVLSKPYIEHFIEDFISSDGNELTFFKIKIENRTWRDIVSNCIKKEMGLPIAYKKNNKIVYPDHIDENLEADGFYILRYPNASNEDISNIILNKNLSERDSKYYEYMCVFNAPTCNAYAYFKEMRTQLNKHNRFKNTKLYIYTENPDDSLNQIDKNIELNIEVIRKNPSLLSVLKDERILSSPYIILLANEYDNNPDGFNFDTINRLKTDLNYEGYIVCEVQEDYDRVRILHEGANSVLRPLRSYPSMIVRSITSKGSERILEMFFNPHKWGKIIEIDMTGYNQDFAIFSEEWHDYVCKFLKKERCLPLGYLSEGRVIINPKEVKGKHYQKIFAYKYE